MEAVLDAPVSSGQGQERLGVGLLGGQAGDVVADLQLRGDDLATSDLSRAEDFYEKSSDEGRRMINQAIYKKIYCYEGVVTDETFAVR